MKFHRLPATGTTESRADPTHLTHRVTAASTRSPCRATPEVNDLAKAVALWDSCCIEPGKARLRRCRRFEFLRRDLQAGRLPQGAGESGRSKTQNLGYSWLEPLFNMMGRR